MMLLKKSLVVLALGVIALWSFHQDAFAADGSSSNAEKSSVDHNSNSIVNEKNIDAKIPGLKTIKIDTVPKTGSVIVDDIVYLSTELPLKFDWKTGSRHTIEIGDKTVKNGDDSRYVFDMWTDQSNDLIKTVTVKNDMSLKAIFKVQNRLKINSDVGTVQGGGWYDEGEVAQFSISGKNIIKDGSVHQYIFDGWSDGENKKSLKGSVTVDAPMTINANWKEQYYIQLTSSVPGKSILGSGWVDKGQKVSLITDKEFQSDSDTKYVFDRWAVTGNNPAAIDNPDSNVASITINDENTVTANWKKFYYVNVHSTYGATVGSGFYEEGTNADISATINEFTILENKHKAVFDRWSVTDALNLPGGSGSFKLQYGNPAQSSLNAQNNQFSFPNIQVKVDKPMTVVAKWKDQYYLDVTSKQGSASGSGWYDAGQTVDIEVSQPSAPPGVWMRYIFDGWSGEVQGNSIKAEVIMTGSKTVNAQWREDYSPAVMNSMIMSGVGAAGLFVYRKTKKHANGIMINNENGMKESKGNWMTVFNGIYNYKRNRERQSSRSNFSSMDYQYALFEPRIPRFL